MEKAAAPAEKVSAPAAKAAPVAPKSTGEGPDPLMHEDDYRGMALLLGKVAGLKIDELSIRKADFRLSLRSGAAACLRLSTPTTSPCLRCRPLRRRSPLPVKRPLPAEAPVKAAEPAADASAYAHVVTAPLVGTFYSSPGPGKSAFVKEGDTVAAGDKVCIVEAMKLFNEIESPAAGKIIKFLVKDGEAVSKGQALIAYEPA